MAAGYQLLLKLLSSYAWHWLQPFPPLWLSFLLALAVTRLHYLSTP